MTKSTAAPSSTIVVWAIHTAARGMPSISRSDARNRAHEAYLATIEALNVERRRLRMPDLLPDPHWDDPSIERRCTTIHGYPTRIEIGPDEPGAREDLDALMARAHTYKDEYGHPSLHFFSSPVECPIELLAGPSGEPLYRLDRVDRDTLAIWYEIEVDAAVSGREGLRAAMAARLALTPEQEQEQHEAFCAEMSRQHAVQRRAAEKAAKRARLLAKARNPIEAENLDDDETDDDVDETNSDSLLNASLALKPPRKGPDGTFLEKFRPNDGVFVTVGPAGGKKDVTRIW